MRNCVRRRASLNAFLVVLAVPTALVSGADNYDVPTGPHSFRLGSGFNSATGKDLDRCMLAPANAIATEKPAPSLAITKDNEGQYNLVPGTLLGLKGSTVFIRMEEVQTRAALRDYLDVKANASLNIGPLKSDLKTQYYKSASFNSNDYFFLLQVLVQNQSQSLNSFDPKPTALDLLVGGNKDGFRKACGDEFVASVSTGGEFLAIIHLRSTSTSEKSSLSTRFGAKFIAFAGQGDYKNDVQKSFEENSGRIVALRVGGDKAVPDPTSPAALKKYATKFIEDVNVQSGSASAYKVGTKRYDETIAFAKLNVQSMTSARVVLEELASRHSDALELRNDMHYILRNPEQFEAFDSDELSAKEIEVTNLINKIRNKATTCELAPTDTAKCQFSSESELALPASKKTLPKRLKARYALRRSSACGIEGYQKKSVLRECRLPEHGSEDVELRGVDWSWTGAAIPNSDLLQQQCEKERPANSHLWAGYDKSMWREGRTYYLKIGKSLPSPVSKFPYAEVWCRTEMHRFQYVLARNPKCGTDQIDDASKPIYKECRDPTHGYEK